MSARHRVNQALTKLSDPGMNWAHQTWRDDKTAYFAVESAKSAQLIREALRHIFKSSRRQVIHNGRKPK